MILDRTRSSLELLLNISRELATTLDLGRVLDRVLTLSIQNVGAEQGSLIVLNENLKPVSAAIYSDHQTRPYTADTLNDIIRDGLAGWVVKKRKPVLIDDTSADKRWLQRTINPPHISSQKSAICAPVTAGDDLMGVLTIVHPKPGFFKEDDLALLKAIADLAGIAIRNAKLYESLSAARQRYYQLFEDSVYPILITDLQGKILEANRQANRPDDLTVKDLIGKKVKDLHEIEPERFSNNLEDLLAGKSIVYESNLIRPDLPPLPIEIHVQKIVFEGVESLQWLIRDISARKELDSLREDLSAMIYHDLRAPLSNIISSLEILDTMLPSESDSSLRSIFQITHRSADRMQRLISSLLDINRLEQGQAITNKKTVDILDLAQEARETVMPSIEGKQQQLELTLAKRIPPLQVDVDMIRRVIINLLENANKFTPVNGKITLGTQLDGKWVKVWVEDNGLGIPAEMREFIFEKFTRLKIEGTPKGVGLGLAFCRMAVEAHGGKIWVEPKSEKGSRFIFTLPIK